jgi:hypothetical protein
MRWLEFIALLFMLSLGALAYFIVRLVRFREDSLKLKGDMRAINPAERETFSWPTEDPANGTDPI